MFRSAPTSSFSLLRAPMPPTTAFTSYRNLKQRTMQRLAKIQLSKISQLLIVKVLHSAWSLKSILIVKALVSLLRALWKFAKVGLVGWQLYYWLSTRPGPCHHTPSISSSHTIAVSSDCTAHWWVDTRHKIQGTNVARNQVSLLRPSNSSHIFTLWILVLNKQNGYGSLRTSLYVLYLSISPQNTFMVFFWKEKMLCRQK